MSILTLKHCILCYQESDTKVEEPSSRTRALNKNGEICRRFCTLSSRYLDMDTERFSSDTTLNSKRRINLESLCDDCVPMAKSFCDIYEQFQYLRLQLDCRVKEAATLMKYADRKNSEFSEHRQALTEKLGEYGRSMKGIDEFRTEFAEAVVRKVKSGFPQLNLLELDRGDPEDVEDEEEDDDLFEVVTRKIKRKKTYPDHQVSPVKKIINSQGLSTSDDGIPYLLMNDNSSKFHSADEIDMPKLRREDISTLERFSINGLVMNKDSDVVKRGASSTSTLYATSDDTGVGGMISD